MRVEKVCEDDRLQGYLLTRSVNHYRNGLHWTEENIRTIGHSPVAISREQYPLAEQKRP